MSKGSENANNRLFVVAAILRKPYVKHLLFFLNQMLQGCVYFKGSLVTYIHKIVHYGKNEKRGFYPTKRTTLR